MNKFPYKLPVYIWFFQSPINTKENISCFTKTMVILKMEDVGKSFTLLTIRVIYPSMLAKVLRLLKEILPKMDGWKK